MNADVNTVRLLGAAQLVVFLASMLSERLLASAAGSGNASETLVHISKTLTRLRISNLVALAFFAAEAITLAVSKIGTFALIPLSQEFVSAGAPDTAHFQTLGDFLYHGIDRKGYDLHMLFFCAGGILWYSLLVVSRVIPRPAGQPALPERADRGGRAENGHRPPLPSGAHGRGLRVCRDRALAGQCRHQCGAW